MDAIYGNIWAILMVYIYIYIIIDLIYSCMCIYIYIHYNQEALVIDRSGSIEIYYHIRRDAYRISGQMIIFH